MEQKAGLDFGRPGAKLESTELDLDKPEGGDHSGSSAPTRAPNLFTEPNFIENTAIA